MRALQTIATLCEQTVSNLWRHKLRSFLTMFGIAWGVFSLVLMTALCDGFRVGQRQNMSQIGDNIVFVYGGRTERQAAGQRSDRRVRLTERDVDAVRQNAPAVGIVSGEIKRGGVTASSSYNSGQFLVLGVSPAYLSLRNLPVSEGRAVSDADVAQGRRVCVLGASVRKQLFEQRRGVLGEQVLVNGYPYKVIGTMSEKQQNSSYDGWDNDKILIPATSLKRDCPPNRETFEEGRVECIIYRPASIEEWKTAQHQVRRTIALAHNFDPEDEGALYFADSIESAQLFDRVFDATEIFLAVISLITLSLGGVGVMNTMLSAVADRTHEIGLRKALGATRRRILLDFFLEGLCLAVVSGIAGMCLVALLAAVVSRLAGDSPMFGGLPIQMSTGLAAVAALGTVAVLASLPPAMRAADLTPIEALREER